MSRELLCQYSSLLEGNWLEYFVGLALRITLRRLVRLLGLAIHIKRARDDLYVRASDEWRAGPSLGLRDVPGRVNLPAERVLHIDHLFARMKRLNTYEAKTNAMTRIGSHVSQVLPPPFICE